MPPPAPLRISPEPWLRADISAGLSHILSAPDALQARTTVAAVDDPVFREGNLALFMNAAPVHRAGWSLLDALAADRPVNLRTSYAIDIFRAALLSQIA